MRWARRTRLEEGGDLTIVGEIVCESSRDLGRLRQIAFPDLDVPHANSASAWVKNSDSTFAAARTSINACFRLPPPSSHFVPHGILVSTI